MKKRITIPPTQHRRSCCPIACALDLIGDRWTLLLIRDLFAGKTRFAQFQRSPEGIATNILASRLGMLESLDLVERQIGESGGHASYHLTSRGRSLWPLLEAVATWGLERIKGTKALVDVPKPG